jgi:hypothetical protein
MNPLSSRVLSLDNAVDRRIVGVYEPGTWGCGVVIRRPNDTEMTMSNSNVNNKKTNTHDEAGRTSSSLRSASTISADLAGEAAILEET